MSPKLIHTHEAAEPSQLFSFLGMREEGDNRDDGSQ